MEHVIDAGRFHHAWNREREPTLRIADGDTVCFDLEIAGVCARLVKRDPGRHRAGERGEIEIHGCLLV